MCHTVSSLQFRRNEYSFEKSATSPHLSYTQTSVIPTRKHTHTHILTHILTHTYSLTHTHTHTQRPHTYSHTRPHTYSHTHIYTHTHTHILTHTYSHTRPHTYSHTHTHIHTYSHTHTHTLLYFPHLQSKRNEPPFSMDANLLHIRCVIASVFFEGTKRLLLSCVGDLANVRCADTCFLEEHNRTCAVWASALGSFCTGSFALALRWQGVWCGTGIC